MWIRVEYPGWKLLLFLQLALVWMGVKIVEGSSFL
jgi:hypothetical protein